MRRQGRSAADQAAASQARGAAGGWGLKDQRRPFRQLMHVQSAAAPAKWPLSDPPTPHLLLASLRAGPTVRHALGV